MTTRPPRLWARGTASPPKPDETAHQLLGDAKLIAVIYAPKAQVAKWVEAELDRDGAIVQTARTMPVLMKALVEDPSPRPNVLVVDIDAVTPGELMELHSLRERGWFGTIIGLGKVPAPLRSSLGVLTSLAPPFVQDQLRDVVAALRDPVETVPIAIIRDEKPPR